MLSQPNYGDYIGATSNAANELMAHGRSLWDWAGTTGTKISDLADLVSGRAGAMADEAAGRGTDMFARWNEMYGPIYQQQAKRTSDFMRDMPATMESWGGKYGADAVSAIDAGKAAQLRKLQGEGLSRPGVGQGAIDLAQSNQRALAKVAGTEQGRMAAMGYGDTLVNATLGQGLAFPQIGAGQQATAMSARNQQIGAPISAAAARVGMEQPGTANFQAATPYLGGWKSAMDSSYQNALAAQQAEQQSSSGSFFSTALPMIAGMGASMLAPGVGTLAAGGLSMLAPTMMGAGTSALGLGRRAVEGGPVSMMKLGGAPTPMAGRTVPPGMSPSGGAAVDDVAATVDGNPQNMAAINTGEFIIPRRAAEWYGEKFLQNLVAKADKERQEQTVAAPQAGPPAGGALNTQPPMMGATA
jgi:hypothetical protein